MDSKDSPSKQQPDRQPTFQPISPAATSAIVSGPNPGERLASYFEKFFTTVVGISTLGASITFSKIVQSPVDPWIDYGISTDQIQAWMSLSWLIFLLALVTTSAFASLLSLYRPQAVEAFSTKDHKNKKMVMWAATATSMLLIGLVFVSFVFLSLVVVGYTGPIGWTALGFTIFFGTLAMGGIIWQSPLEWPSCSWLLPQDRDSEITAPSTPPKDSGLGWTRFGSDPFLRHINLHHQGSLRHKRSFNDLHGVADEKQQYEDILEKGGATISQSQRYSWQEPPPPREPRRDFRHDRKDRYSQEDHFTQLNTGGAGDRGSKASQRTLVPGASPAWDERGHGWARTIPPVRYGYNRPNIAALAGIE